MGITSETSKWRATDIVIKAHPVKDNPFEHRVVGQFTGPGGEQLSVPGFYDGDDSWVVRFAPTAEGRWDYTTASDVAGVDGLTGTIMAGPNTRLEVHGALGVDPSAPSHFLFEDGTRPFLIGYECDWLFALDLAEGGLSRTLRLVDDIAANGFNQVVMNVYAHDVKWGGEGQGGEHDFGPPAAYVFGGTNDQPDHTVLNTSFFKHLDQVIRLLWERGILAHLMIYVWNKQVSWPQPLSAEDDRYLDYVIARYQAFCNVIWDVSKEALLYGSREPEYVTGRIARIRSADAYHRLVTVHDDRYCRECPDQVDFYSIQFWGTQLHAKMRSLRDQHPSMPIYNIEHGGYEKGPYRTFTGDYQDPVSCLQRNYECAFAGTYSTYYWQGASWDIVIWDAASLPPDQRPRYDFFRHMQAFFGQVGFHRLIPFAAPASSGLCLADPGKVYLLYKADGQCIHVGLPEGCGTYAAEWFNPLTGEMRDAGTYDSFSWREFFSPWGTGMAVLKLVRVGVE